MARIIITGASDGIGAEMARQLAQTHGSRLQLTRPRAMPAIC
jgi:short-subunit dehydrogenase